MAGFAAGDANLYRYVGNGPLNFTDPTGLVQAGNPLDALAGGYGGNSISAYNPNFGLNNSLISSPTINPLAVTSPGAFNFTSPGFNSSSPLDNFQIATPVASAALPSLGFSSPPAYATPSLSQISSALLSPGSGSLFAGIGPAPATDFSKSFAPTQTVTLGGVSRQVAFHDNKTDLAIANRDVSIFNSDGSFSGGAINEFVTPNGQVVPRFTTRENTTRITRLPVIPPEPSGFDLATIAAGGPIGKGVGWVAKGALSVARRIAPGATARVGQVLNTPLSRGGVAPARVGADLTISRPAILNNQSLSVAERAVVEKSFRVKTRAIQSAARRGELTFSPGTDTVRVSQLQAAYRTRVIERFERIFVTRPNLTRLDADHPVDLIIGGPADQRLQLIHRSINRSIGSSLRNAGERAGLQSGDAIRSIDIDGGF